MPKAKKNNDDDDDDDGMVDETVGCAEEAEQRKVSSKLMEVSKRIEEDDSNESDDGNNPDVRLKRSLQKNVDNQKLLLETGRLVGAKGKPSQIVQDAHMSNKANTQGKGKVLFYTREHESDRWAVGAYDWLIDWLID